MELGWKDDYMKYEVRSGEKYEIQNIRYEIRGQIWREQVIDESLLLAAAPFVGNAEQHSVMDH